MRCYSRTTKQGERGFALLFVFLMAAIIGLYLYMQLPRVAFESERDKEQLLIDRGEQYKRAIQLYVIAVKKYPSKIEDLENTNDKRYLRQRYIDPFTGKDEWRLIHVNAAGVLTDSLVQKPPTTPDGSTPGSNSGQPGQQNGQQSGASSFFGSTGSTGANTNGQNGTTPPDPNDVNQTVRKRPSDVVGQAYTTPTNGDPNDPSTWAPITLAPVNNGANGTAPTGQAPSGAMGFNGGLPGQTPGQPGQPGVAPGFPLPGQPGFNPTQNQFKIDQNGNLVPVQPPQAPMQTGVGNPTGLNPNGGFQNPGTPQQAAPGMGGAGMNPFGNSAATQNAATAAINNALTNPNPQAGGGLGTSQGMTTGGIAGVASMYKGTSIKTYATRQKYQEWEFIFSLNNQQNGQNQNRNPLGNPSQTGPNGASGATGTGAPAFGSTVGSTTSSTGN